MIIFRFLSIVMLLINRLNISSNKTIYGGSSSRGILFCLASPSTSTSSTSTSSSSTSSSSISPTNIESNDINEIIEEEKENIAIPLLPPSISSENKDDAENGGNSAEMRTLKLGETLKLDEFGPIIINPDGTARRIANWDTLSPQEKASSFRLISARNKKRLQKLKEEQEKKQEDNTS